MRRCRAFRIGAPCDLLAPVIATGVLYGPAVVLAAAQNVDLVSAIGTVLGDPQFARLGMVGQAYNLGNLWRRLVLPKRIERWSLTSLQQRLVKTGGRLVKHARYYWLFLAESHLTRRLFAAMLQRIWALPVPTG